jgi:hypothetical protein
MILDLPFDVFFFFFWVKCTRVYKLYTYACLIVEEAESILGISGSRCVKWKRRRKKKLHTNAQRAQVYIYMNKYNRTFLPFFFFFFFLT